MIFLLTYQFLSFVDIDLFWIGMYVVIEFCRYVDIGIIWIRMHVGIDIVGMLILIL